MRYCGCKADKLKDNFEVNSHPFYDTFPVSANTEIMEVDYAMEENNWAEFFLSKRRRNHLLLGN